MKKTKRAGQDTSVSGLEMLGTETEIGGDVPTNGGAAIIAYTEPYIAQAVLVGISDFLFHRWNPDAVREKSRAAKGSKAKNTDDLESFVYRNEAGYLAIPGEYIRQAVIHAAKFRQDPRSPRKSAMDLYKAGIIALTVLCSLNESKWDYEDCRRVVVQRNGINRTRPAMKAGWTVTCEILVNLPEYISQSALLEMLVQAGRLIGLGDYRPTYGRFQVREFKIIPE